MTQSDVFLGKEFHQAIEHSPPSGITPFYSLIKSDCKTIGICYFQLKRLKIAEALKIEKGNSISLFFKKLLARRINFYSLVCGNAMVTGSYGFRFAEDIDKNTAFELMTLAGKNLISKLKKEENINVGPFLVKDFYEKELYGNKDLEEFTKFCVQPSMILKLESNWTSFDDYLGDMKTKYRTRAKRALKKLGSIETRSLDLNEIQEYSDTMYKLYSYVADQATFNLFHLHKNYFFDLKEKLQDQFDVVGYFDGNKMVGFYTVILNKEHLDAHFLGYDKEVNSSSQLYLNMLYDMIRKGIGWKMKKIFMSRTALEIKSSTGAEAKEMYCYLKHTQRFYNAFLSYILDTLVPEEDWIPRSPFKD